MTITKSVNIVQGGGETSLTGAGGIAQLIVDQNIQYAIVDSGHIDSTVSAFTTNAPQYHDGLLHAQILVFTVMNASGNTPVVSTITIPGVYSEVWTLLASQAHGAASKTFVYGTVLLAITDDITPTVVFTDATHGGTIVWDWYSVTNTRAGDTGLITDAVQQSLTSAFSGVSKANAKLAALTAGTSVFAVCAMSETVVNAGYTGTRPVLGSALTTTFDVYAIASPSGANPQNIAATSFLPLQQSGFAAGGWARSGTGLTIEGHSYSTAVGAGIAVLAFELKPTTAVPQYGVVARDTGAFGAPGLGALWLSALVGQRTIDFAAPIGSGFDGNGNLLKNLAVAAWKTSTYTGTGSLLNLGSVGAALDATFPGGTNNPTWLPYTGQQYAYCPGVGGTDVNLASTPDSATISPTGDIEGRIVCEPTASWVGTTRLLWGKWGSGTQRSWDLQVIATGALRFRSTPDGTFGSLVQSTSTVVLPAGTARLALKFTLDVDNGAAGNTVRFYTSVDYNPATEVGTWTQLGADVVNAGVTSVFDGTDTLEVGGEGAVAQNYDGKIYRAQLYNGIAGTKIADYNPALSVEPHVTFTAATGEVWTHLRATSGKKLAVVGQNMLLFGTDDYLTIADNANLDFAVGVSFTVIACYRLYGTTVTQAIIAKRANDTNNTVGWKLDRGSTANTPLFLADDGTVHPSDSAGTAFTQGVHAVGWGIRDASADTVTGGFNASAETGATDTTTATLENATAFTIGADASGRYADMEFLGAAVFRSALSTTQIAEVVAELGGVAGGSGTPFDDPSTPFDGNAAVETATTGGRLWVGFLQADFLTAAAVTSDLRRVCAYFHTDGFWYLEVVDDVGTVTRVVTPFGAASPLNPDYFVDLLWMGQNTDLAAVPGQEGPFAALWINGQGPYTTTVTGPSVTSAGIAAKSDGASASKISEIDCDWLEVQWVNRPDPSVITQPPVSP